MSVAISHIQGFLTGQHANIELCYQRIVENSLLQTKGRAIFEDRWKEDMSGGDARLRPYKPTEYPLTATEREMYAIPLLLKKAIDFNVPISSPERFLHIALNPTHVGTDYTVFLTLYAHLKQRYGHSATVFTEDMKRKLSALVSHHILENVVKTVVGSHNYEKNHYGVDKEKLATMKLQVAEIMEGSIDLLLEDHTKGEVLKRIERIERTIESSFATKKSKLFRPYCSFPELPHKKLKIQGKDSKFYVATNNAWTNNGELRAKDNLKLLSLVSDIDNYLQKPQETPKKLQHEANKLKKHTFSLLKDKSINQRDEIVRNIDTVIAHNKYRPREPQKKTSVMSRIKTLEHTLKGKGTSWKQTLFGGFASAHLKQKNSLLTMTIRPTSP